MVKKKIHPSIKERLGYDPDMLDKEFLADWKKRSTQVCKPCWELKYCPYGPFVEQSPLLPTTLDEANSHIEYIKNLLASNTIGSESKIDESRREQMKEMLAFAEKNFDKFASYVSRDFYLELQVDRLGEEGKDIYEVFSGELPPIEKYKVPFPLIGEESIGNDLDREKLPPEVIAYANDRKKKLKIAIESGIEDTRRPLDKARKLSFEREVEEFKQDEYPDFIPEVVSDMECNIFGHICPVVFVGESITETTETRRQGRYISFTTKVRVVRRDNYTCQHCSKHLRDDEVEFDHIIPVAKGGSSEEHNIRLTCFDCNREKSDKVEI